MNVNQIKKIVINFPFMMATVSLVGLAASMILAIEKVHLLQNPGVELSCSLNPVYSCQSVIMSDQASILGFSNEFIGIAYFGGMLALALALLSGAKFGVWLYKLVWLGLFGAMGFVFWFFYQSVFNINALCIYCTVTWLAIWTLTITYTRWLLNKKIVSIPKKYNKIETYIIKYAPIIWFFLILLFATIILNHFWYYYGQYF